MKKIFAGAFLFLAVLATSWALLYPGFFRVHDYIHATRISEVLRAVQEGHFPVRWSANLGYGYGMPAFQFYAPLPYYVGAFFYWLGFDVVTAIKLLYLTCTVGTFIGMYTFVSRLTGRAGGVLAATALTLAPYRAVNLFVRGSLSEAWAIMALPWVLLGIHKVVKREKHGWVTLVASLVVLFLSHNITTMLFVPLTGLFALVMIAVEKKGKTVKLAEVFKQILLPLAGSYVLAVGLCAFYLFPALLEKDFTQVTPRILSGYFHYSQHFLYLRQFTQPNWKYEGSTWGPDDDISFFLGWGQILGVMVTGVLMAMYLWNLWQKTAKTESRGARIKQVFWAFVKARAVQLVALFGVLFSVAIFMTLLKSQPIWDVIPALQVVQFPWRWLSIVSTMLAVLAGLAVVFIKVRFLRFVYVTTLILIIILGNFNFFRPKEYLENPDDFYYTDVERIRKNMSEIWPDYIPSQMSDKPMVPPQEIFLVPGGVESQVEVVVNKGHAKLFRTNFISDVDLNVMIADFPGWKVEIDGETLPDSEKFLGQNGTIAVHVPAGQHLVGFYFGATPVRFWSDAVSLLSFVILLVFLVQPTFKTTKSTD